MPDDDAVNVCRHSSMNDLNNNIILWMTSYYEAKASSYGFYYLYYCHTGWPSSPLWIVLRKALLF